MKKFFMLIIAILCATAAASSGSMARTYAQSGDAQPCPSDQTPVLFGTTVSLTGSLSREGADTLQGYQLWVDWVNTEIGGIEVGDQRYCVALKYYDDESKGDKAAELTETLITTDKVSFLLGPYSSGLTSRASEISEKHKVIMVEGNGAADSLFTRKFKYFFGVLTPGSNYTKAALEAAAKLGAKSLVIAYENTDFPKTVADGAQQWAKELGLTVLAFESYPEGATDLTDMFTKFRDLKPDLFVGGGHFNDAVVFTKTAKAIGFNPSAFIMTVGPSSSDFIKELGKDAEFVWGATQWEPSMKWEGYDFGTPAEYAKRFQEKYNEQPNYQNAESTAAAIVLQRAIEKAGTLDTEAVRMALAGTDLDTFYGPIKFDETGKNIAKPMGAIQIQKGKIVTVAPADVAAAKPIYPAPAWDKR